MLSRNQKIGLSIVAALARSASARPQDAPSPPQPAQTQPANQPAQSQPASQPAQSQPADEIILREALVIERVGQYGRAAVHNDAVEVQLVQGTWAAPAPPKAGDSITLPDGSTRVWTAASAGEDGWLRHPALGGGYALFTVESPTDRIMLLHARGHNGVYVNRELRTGDPYNLGFVVLPVALRAGPNEFLFQCTRGQLWAKLQALKAPVTLLLDAERNVMDLTAPDVIAGQPIDLWGGVVVINATAAPLRNLQIIVSPRNQAPTAIDAPAVPALGMRKIAFHLQGPAMESSPPDGPTRLEVRLELQEKTGDPPQRTLDTAEFVLGIVQPNDLRKRTFISEIDGSVQYYAVRPAAPAPPLAPGSAGGSNVAATQPALILTLHGASVEASGQAAAYRSKPWSHIVAPTNRRPFGFDWEDWGRLDALEVLDLAQRDLNTDPQKVYLTGHSMGGHGTWNIGVHFPDRFAAIGPSAGWISFWSYAGAAKFEHPTLIQEMLMRAASPSDTLGGGLSRNFLQQGIYILHGDQDDNVPVDQARQMRKHLAEFHPDFAYHEQPGAGHWWGDACVDWPPMMEFFQHHALTPDKDVNRIEFATASPGVSAKCHWASIEAQQHSMKVSAINLTRDPKQRKITGTTENVARLAIGLIGMEPGGALSLELDTQKLEGVAWPANGDRIWLGRRGETWAVIEKPAANLKGPQRCGPFKDAFRNRMMFVYGTRGTPEENAWAFAKARLDAETFWYRGNGSIDVIADSQFNPADEVDRNRNVILYGNSDTNSAWPALLGDSPVQAKRASIRIGVGGREIAGEDLACLFIRPRPGSDVACVAAVCGSGLIGMRLTDRLPYFVSGVGYPDCIVIGAEALSKNTEGVRAAGFFGEDWSIETGDFASRE